MAPSASFMAQKRRKAMAVQAHIQAVGVVGESNKAVDTVCEGGDLRWQNSCQCTACNHQLRLDPYIASQVSRITPSKHIKDGL